MQQPGDETFAQRWALGGTQILVGLRVGFVGPPMPTGGDVLRASGLFLLGVFGLMALTGESI